MTSSVTTITGDVPASVTTPDGEELHFADNADAAHRWEAAARFEKLGRERDAHAAKRQKNGAGLMLTIAVILLFFAPYDLSLGTTLGMILAITKLAWLTVTVVMNVKAIIYLLTSDRTLRKSRTEVDELVQSLIDDGSLLRRGASDSPDEEAEPDTSELRS